MIVIFVLALVKLTDFVKSRRQVSYLDPLVYNCIISYRTFATKWDVYFWTSDLYDFNANRWIRINEYYCFFLSMMLEEDVISW